MNNAESEFFIENPEQIEWLENDLAEHQDAEWKFVFLHKPPFSSGGQYYVKDRIKLKEILVPIFDRFGVEMVFAGHDHNYERTVPIGSRDADIPTTYVVSGNGGTPMRYVIPRQWTRFAERVFGFTHVSVNGSKIHLRHITIDGALLDEFTLDKDDPASIEDYKVGMLVYEEMTDVPVEVATLVRYGRSLLKDDEYEDAIVLFEVTLERDPNCFIAKGQMAKCFLELGDLERARNLATETIEEIPQFPDSYEALIEVCIKEEKYDEALMWCDRLEGVTSDSPDANEMRAEVFEEMGEIKRAIVALEDAVRILPSDYELYFDLAEYYDEIGDTAKVIESLKKGIEWYLEPEIEEDYTEAVQLLEELTK